ncbi:uncharacterized protein LOC114534458 [Dendronephthya gigantea]|uniref:uncharacterized protein LOC114534458 n=1 Tax=Dendronephthya gigantea TaxID=151771 RepID=UPI00106CFBC2|nr:uncharacterized protein LOC114534458 [Dendronephthya gigantea]XP_028411702.1 uncharacterized protein LOC114534458 [Dendronephthya gigantea]
MAASRFASYDTGYDDERFEQIVSKTLHCIICTNVIKDPVMCRHNEHVFCRGCITRHLMYSQTCPTCIEPLTADTLKVPRNIANLISELKIRCELFDRGCERFIELGDLEKHVAECGFAPAFCSNEGCGREVNKQDLLHHETAVCELRVVKGDEMNIIKVNLASINEKLERNEAKVAAIEENVSKVEKLVQEQLEKQEESNRRLEADNVEVKKCLNEITKQLKKGIPKADGMDREPKVVVAGGEESGSVEMFNLASGTWTPLQAMREHREGATSFVHNNQLFILGGWRKTSLEKLSLDDAQIDQSTAKWEIVPAELPGSLYRHCSVLYLGRLLVIGGFHRVTYESSDRITEISLAAPYTIKVLSTMPQGRYLHGAALFGDKILIVGGRENISHKSIPRNVLMCDIIKNECQELAPLPYPVSQMATVKWSEDNVIIMGGVDSNHKALSTVLIYNIKTQKSHMLPDMKYKRKGCVAAVVRDTVIVMGGQDERGNALKSVESFRFDRYSWEELPEMHEARYEATAAVW